MGTDSGSVGGIAGSSSRLRDLALRTSYRKGVMDIAAEFYLPCMSTAVRYDRAVGFFSSAVFTLAWSSLETFIRRGGRMRFVCSHILSRADIAALEQGYESRVLDAAVEQLQRQFDEMLAEPGTRDPCKILATLVGMGVISMKIAVLRGSPGAEVQALFHDKLGIFTDEHGEHVVFKGSMNETWLGLSNDGNLESVDVFLSWEAERERHRVLEQIAHFESLWRDDFPSAQVLEFPEALRAHMLKATEDVDLGEVLEAVNRKLQAAEGRAHGLVSRRTLYAHQVDALDTWKRNGRRGILEHATGSGKSHIGLCAMRESLRRGEVPVLVVPSTELLNQWHLRIRVALADLAPALLLCGAGHSQWRKGGLLRAWTRERDVGSSRSRIVLAMLQTASSPDFLSNVCEGGHIFLLVDEVHRAGSVSFSNLLTLDTGARLGLSATPRRAGDSEGTTRLLRYFGGILPSRFELADGIHLRVLTPYFYFVHPVELSTGEREQWETLTSEIRRTAAIASSGTGSLASNTDRANERLKLLAIQRARIAKKAASKARAAISVISSEYHAGERWLVYCEDIEQLAEVTAGLRSLGLPATEYHSMMDGDRRATLARFEDIGGIIVSIRCLDEGVDIPVATHALIMASSRNPREFIQRRGRVLRAAPGKSVSHIHDLLVMPPASDEQEPWYLPLLHAEVARAIQFGATAVNTSGITEISRHLARLGLDPNELVDVGYEDDEQSEEL